MAQETLTKEQLYNAVNLVTMMAVSDLAERNNTQLTEMLLDFMASQTSSLLYDTETRLWCDGPAAVEAEYIKEKEGRVHGQ